MNTRMERLLGHDEYHSGPVETRRHVNPEHLRIATAEVAEFLDRVMADITKARKGGGVMSATTEWLMESTERHIDVLSARVDHLEVVNAGLLAALADLTREFKRLVYDGDPLPDFIIAADAAIAKAKEGRS